MKIAIIGCGYVGKRLAKLWCEKGYTVTCTTRSLSNLEAIDPFCQKGLVVKSSDQNEINLLVENNDVIAITVAAKKAEDYRNTYLKTAQAIRSAALSTKEPKILFYTSSSSVYGEHEGHFVDESSDLKGKSEQAEILIETEKTYLSLKEKGWRTCLFRLSEIYGPERDFETRMKKLQGQVIPGTGYTYTNMIHQEDIAQAIDYALTHKLEGIYNLADDEHPIRREFYNHLCDQLQLKHILWDANLKRMHEGNKRVSNHKIKAAGYQLIYPKRVMH